MFSVDYAVEEKPSEVLLLQQLEEGGPEPLVFVLNANLLAMVKLVNCKRKRLAVMCYLFCMMIV